MSDSSKRVVVTGGCGYIGAHTITDLQLKGYEVVSIDNLSRSNANMLERVASITGKKLVNHAIDLRDEEALNKIFLKEEHIHAIIHFAAFKAVGESVEDSTLYYDNNMGALMSILSMINKHGINNFVFSSSCSVYGNSTVLPVTETTPLNRAESPYGHTKQLGERVIEYFSKVNDCRFITLRYFNPVGAHESGLLGEVPYDEPENLIPLITLTAAGTIDKLNVHGDDYPTKDGTCIRDYIHIMDIAEAHTLAMQYAEKSTEKYTVFNLGSGTGTSVMEAIKAFEKVNDIKLNYSIGPKREGDVAAIYSDNALARKELGWKPKRDLETIMLSAWKWQQAMLEENILSIERERPKSNDK